MQKLRSYTAVETHPTCHILNISPYRLTKIGDFIDERNFGRKKRIRCIFRQLCRATISKKNRCIAEEQGPIKLPEHIARIVRMGANNNSIGTHKVLYR